MILDGEEEHQYALAESSMAAEGPKPYKAVVTHQL